MFFGGEGKEIHPYIPGMLFFPSLVIRRDMQISMFCSVTL